MRRAFALILLAVMLTGCAEVGYALREFPARTKEMWEDPVRPTHLFTKINLEATTATVGITCAAFVPFPFSLGVCPLLAVLYNFGMFEFILEPASKDLVKDGKPSLVGPYWETGPRMDEGEAFICGEKPSYTCHPKLLVPR